MSSKTYVFVEEKPLYNRVRYFVKDKIKIICIGGENMPEEKPKLVFVKTATIPKMSKGKTGRNWKELFAQIPEGESLVVPEDYGTGATIKSAVKNINEELKKQVYAVTQRTIGEKVTVYVTRV